MTKTPYNIVNDTRLQQLAKWLKAQGYDYKSLTPITVDAGFRRYFRLSIADDTLIADTLIAVDAPPEYEDTGSFLKIATTLFDSGAKTPQVYCYNLENGFMLLSDLGSLHLQDAATPADPKSAQTFYKSAVTELINIQHSAPSCGLPAYSADFLQQELQLFPDWYLQQHLQKSYSAFTRKQLQQCFDLCIDSALEQPAVFVHRDYHCRNLMVQSDNRIAIIDFQGALKGPITYDLVSLLRDAYVEWPATFVDPLMEIHRQSLATTSATHVSADTYQRWFDLMGLQRHLKILGIFSRLHHRDGKSNYLSSMPLVLRHIHAVCRCYPELSVLCDILAQASPAQSPHPRDLSE